MPHTVARGRSGAELLAQLADVHVDRALVALPVDAPHAVEQLAAGERHAEVVGQVLQQVELARGERHRPAADPRLPAHAVDLDVADQRPRRAVAGGPSVAAQDGLHPGDELARRERLGDVVVGAELEPEHAVDLVVAGGQHDDRQRRRRPGSAGTPRCRRRRRAGRCRGWPAWAAGCAT